MTIAESIARTVNQLPPDQQHEALALIERLKQKYPSPLKNPQGIAAAVAFDLSLEEFQTLRREMWGESTDREIEWPR